MGKRVENLYACDLNGSSSLHSRYYMLLCLIMALCMNISNKKTTKAPHKPLKQIWHMICFLKSTCDHEHLKKKPTSVTETHRPTFKPSDL